ncbi:hypothetical protein BH11ACT3_BH11ACT3_13980 [soil metagenome]
MTAPIPADAPVPGAAPVAPVAPVATVAAAPVGYAPVAPPTRNPLGVVALVIEIFVLVAPLAIGIVATVLAATTSVQTPDSTGWAVLAGLIFWPVAACFAAPIALVGVVLAIIALTRKGARKGPAVAALIIGAIPSLFVFGLPVALQFFG